MAPIALVRDAIRFTMDQLELLNPRSAQTGFMYNAKQLFIIAVGMKDIRNAATSTPQPENFFFSAIEKNLLEILCAHKCVKFVNALFVNILTRFVKKVNRQLYFYVY